MYILQHIYSSSMQTSKDLYLAGRVLNRNEQQCCQKAKHSTSINPLTNLACQLFNINYLQIWKTPFFGTVDLVLIVKPNIIIIVMNTDKQIRFIENLQKLEKMTHFRPALWTETYSFEYIAQWNNMKTS